MDLLGYHRNRRFVFGRGVKIFTLEYIQVFVQIRQRSAYYTLLTSDFRQRNIFLFMLYLENTKDTNQILSRNNRVLPSVSISFTYANYFTMLNIVRVLFNARTANLALSFFTRTPRQRTESRHYTKVRMILRNGKIVCIISNRLEYFFGGAGSQKTLFGKFLLDTLLSFSSASDVFLKNRNEKLLQNLWNTRSPRFESINVNTKI